MSKPITAKQMKNLIADCRNLIEEHIKKNGLTIHAFAVQCNVHPNQMYMFLRADRGLNLTTMQKIGDILSQ